MLGKMWAPCASAAALMAASSASAGTLWVANLSGAGENPPNTSTFTGTGFLVLNDAETQASITWTHTIPANQLTGGHIHRGPANVNGPIIVPFPNPASPGGPVPYAIPALDVANLKAAGLYMNFHTAQFPGGVIRSQLTRATLAPAASNPAQLAVANALDVSAGYTSDMDAVLMGAAVASPTARAQLLDDLSGRTLYSQGRQAAETMVDQGESLFREAEDMADAPQDGPRLFARVGESFGRRDTQAGQAGARISRTALIAGVGHQFGAVTAGLAAGYADGKDKFRSGGGRADAKTTSVHAFASVGGFGGPVVTAQAAYGWTNFDLTRNLSSLSRSATASPDGKVWALAARASMPFALSGATTISPYAQLDMQHATIDGYQEAGAGSAGLIVPKHKQKASALEAGAAIALPLNGMGEGLSARLQAGWRHALEDGEHNVTTAFVGSPVVFLTPVQGASRNAAHLEATLEGKLGTNLSVAAGYRGFLANHSNVHAVELRLTWAK